MRSPIASEGCLQQLLADPAFCNTSLDFAQRHPTLRASPRLERRVLWLCFLMHPRRLGNHRRFGCSPVSSPPPPCPHPTPPPAPPPPAHPPKREHPPPGPRTPPPTTPRK